MATLEKKIEVLDFFIKREKAFASISERNFAADYETNAQVLTEILNEIGGTRG